MHTPAAMLRPGQQHAASTSMEQHAGQAANRQLLNSPALVTPSLAALRAASPTAANARVATPRAPPDFATLLPASFSSDFEAGAFPAAAACALPEHCGHGS